MLKILVTILLLSSSLCLNPGVYGFVSKKTIETLKDSAWPKVKDLLSNITIDGEQKNDLKVGTLTTSDLKVQIKLEANGVKIHLDSGNNVVKSIADKINFDGSGHYQYKYGQQTTSGDLSFSGIIGSLEADLNLDDQQMKDGLVPKVVLDAVILNNVSDQKVHASGSAIAPIINVLTHLLQDRLESEITKKFSKNGDLQDKLNTQLNQNILDYYPVAVPISQYGIAISTYTTGPVKVFDTGLQVPAEGFGYAIDSGYKKIENCKEMQNYVDPANVTSDFYAALGDCTVQSVLNAQAETNFRYHFIKKTTLANIDLVVLLKQSDYTTVEFHKNTLKVGVAIYLSGKVGVFKTTVTANAVANVSQTKKSATNEVHAWNPAYKKLFPGMTDEILVSYDILAKIERLDNFKVSVLPGFQATLLKNELMKEEFTKSYDIPKVCVANEVCLKGFNAVIKEGFIETDASVEIKPLREEIS